MDIEYNKTLKEVNELFEWAEKETISAKLPPCQEEKAKVICICYSESFLNRFTEYTLVKQRKTRILLNITKQKKHDKNSTT